MERRKTLQELTLKDNFLFAAVMMEQENCKRLLKGCRHRSDGSSPVERWGAIYAVQATTISEFSSMMNL